MPAVPGVPLSWIVDLVNGYGRVPREVAGESAHPYPALTGAAPSPAQQLERRELVELADALWPAFNQHEPATQAATLNGLLTAGALMPGLDTDGIVHWSTEHRSTREVTAAACAIALFSEVERGGWHQLGVCDGTDCVDVHVHERGRRRRYCSTICLNRARVRAYRARG